VIDRTGRIAQIWPKVKVDGHVQDVLEFVAG
jgi:peroxiredoxin